MREREQGEITTPALWDDTVNETHYPALTGALEVDVAVIGAGITGLTTALHLQAAGLRVAVIEARRVGSGTTGDSTGNLYAPVGPGLASIEEKHSIRTAGAVVQARAEAVDFMEQTIASLNISCDFQRVPFYLFSSPDEQADGEVHQEFATAARAGLNPFDLPPPGFPFSVSALLGLSNQAQFNPLQYVQGLAAAIDGPGCRIFENSPVLETEDGEPCRVVTSAGTVTAAHVVKATHTPQGIYAVHAAMTPHREYAVVARIEETLPAGIYWNANAAWQYSVRPWSTPEGNFLLVLGKSYKPGEQKMEDLAPLKSFIRTRFPTASIDYVWAAQNYQSADHLPYIGTSPTEQRTWMATGFAADGLVWGTIAGKAIADGIQGKESRYLDLFNPQRFTPVASAKNFLKENAAVSRHLLKDYLFYGQTESLAGIAAGEGKTLKVDGERVAVYRHESGKLSIVSAVCSHMGCIVHWNGLEKSWDCPCHGSRFSVDGVVLEGPAQSNLAKPLEPG